MGSYLAARQDKGFPRFPLMMKGVAAFVLSSFIVVLAQGPATAPSGNAPSFPSTEKNDKREDEVLQSSRTAFFDRLKAMHPSTFKQDARGKARITLAAQSFYTCTPGGEQEVVTSKSYSKERVLFQLNQNGIAYNLEEGLGMWTIQWKEQLFLPTL